MLLPLAVSAVVLLVDHSKHGWLDSDEGRETLLVLLALGWLIKSNFTKHLADRFQPMDHHAIFHNIYAAL